MKHSTRLFTILAILISTLIVCSSFSNPVHDNEAILRNVEVLTRGEESENNDCVVSDGKCITNGVRYWGMSIIL